jgi:hypothetical protein
VSGRSCECDCIKWYQSDDSFLYISGRRRQKKIKEHSDTHQVVSEHEKILYFL